jgi:hypothetical protein
MTGARHAPTRATSASHAPTLEERVTRGRAPRTRIGFFFDVFFEYRTLFEAL